MARTFKFSFPLPSRKQSAERQSTLIYDGGDLPLYNPGAKAEMILGMTESKSADPKKQSKKEKKLRRHQSFMNVTITDVDGSLQDGDVGSLKSPQLLHNQPSSPLLGQQYVNDSPDWGSATDVSGLPHRSQSSSTLHSYYDSSKSPLYISQQTSASSARDMALRKAHFATVSPLSQDISKPIKTSKAKDKHHERNSPITLSKRRPGLDLQLDISSNYQKPSALNRHIAPPQTIVQSPSQISETSNSHQTVQASRPKWFGWERKKSRESSQLSVPSPQQLSRIEKETPTPEKPTAYMHAKKPRNWFNDYSEDSTPEDYSQQPIPGYQLPENYGSSAAFKRNEHSGKHRLRRSKSSISEVSQEPLPPRSASRSHQNDALLQLEDTSVRQRAYSNGAQSPPSDGSRKSDQPGKKELTIILSQADLHTQSFLTLSSSEDESEGRTDSETCRRHRIRASIVKADTGDEVLVCSAERVKPVKPRPVVNIPRRRTGSSKSIDPIPPVPSLPSRPKLNPRVSSMKWQDESKVVQPGMEINNVSDHSRESSITSCSTSRISQTSSQKKMQIRGSKMMAVTAEEEKLLEAMRRKRASIRQEVLAEHVEDGSSLYGSKTPTSRPRTAGADGRPGISSYFDIDRSTSSPPPTHGYAKHIDVPSYAASTGDLSQEDSYSSPSPSQRFKIPTVFTFPSSLPKTIPITYYPQKPAPSLSFSPSDILPSTPAMSDATGDDMYGAVQYASRSSPLTPPPAHVLDVYESELVVAALDAQQSSFYLEKKGHDRNRTISSSVVVLDGAEREVQDLDEANVITGWAMDRW